MAKLPLKWMAAKAFGGLFKRPAPTCVVVHCTESENTPAMAEALAGPGWFGGSKAGTSSHKVVDVDSICEGVHRSNVAYHAGPGGNTVGIAYEFCGRASWSAARWREPAQLQMLANAAPHIADDLIAITGSRAAALAKARWLSLVQLAGREHGLCTHNDVRLALGGTTHTDPGPNFPYAELLALVVAELGGQTAPAAPTVKEPDVSILSIAPGQHATIPRPRAGTVEVDIAWDDQGLAFDAAAPKAEREGKQLVRASIRNAKTGVWRVIYPAAGGPDGLQFWLPTGVAKSIGPMGPDDDVLVVRNLHPVYALGITVTHLV